MSGDHEEPDSASKRAAANLAVGSSTANDNAATAKESDRLRADAILADVAIAGLDRWPLDRRLIGTELRSMATALRQQRFR